MVKELAHEGESIWWQKCLCEQQWEKEIAEENRALESVWSTSFPKPGSC